MRNFLFRTPDSPTNSALEIAGKRALLFNIVGGLLMALGESNPAFTFWGLVFSGAGLFDYYSHFRQASKTESVEV
ncbi:MAG TPA: hypothetical protein VJC17_01420 [Candidatus Dojkabacteria bacterium]|nr:hypothetical protein [Candidatus Dojkabacteria bacterium]